MSLLSLVILAIALAADSFVAAAARGSGMFRPTMRHAVLVAAVFAAAQMLMPLVGWQVGIGYRPVVERVDHWIAFVILGGLGAKMILDALRRDDGPVRRPPAYTLSALLLAAVATSIDAFVAGFGFGVLNISVLAALAVIGGTTFVLSFAGVYAGRRFGDRYGRYVGAGGGMVLIVIGVKIIVDHTQ